MNSFLKDFKESFTSIPRNNYELMKRMGSGLTFQDAIQSMQEDGFDLVPDVFKAEEDKNAEEDAEIEMAE